MANGSFGLYLLGIVCEKQTRYADAKDYYLRALEANPTLWSAYEKLGKLGDHVNPGKVFSDMKLKVYETTQTKKANTPLSAKRKKEDEEKEKVRRGGNQTQLPKRKNSIHGSDSGGKVGGVGVGLMSLLRRFGEGYHLLCMYHCL